MRNKSVVEFPPSVRRIIWLNYESLFKLKMQVISAIYINPFLVCPRGLSHALYCTTLTLCCPSPFCIFRPLVVFFNYLRGLVVVEPVWSLKSFFFIYLFTLRAALFFDIARGLYGNLIRFKSHKQNAISLWSLFKVAFTWHFESAIVLNYWHLICCVIFKVSTSDDFSGENENELKFIEIDFHSAEQEHL